jgi:hypothetical protein
MSTQHPLAPPPELVASLRNSAPVVRDAGVTRELWLIDHAYAAGADQELEACIQLLDINGCPGKWIDMLRAARRPKPPSLKEQALKAIGVPTKFGEARVIEHREHELVRRALEALND